MAKTIQVNLQFNANVENAKKQMQSLQNQLNSVINNASGNGKLGMTTQIQEATRSAMDLKIALNNAVNVNTGKLNLNKFQSELQRSGKTISEYAQQLRMLGPEGVKAFNQIASAVASADTKLFNLSGGLKKFSDTMFNTLRWSVASSAIQGVTSAISGTISYAKELDTSLNNIRIVTGKSNEEMAKFAETANKMAKTLSSTTKKYSDASLIYFQQGLTDKEVKERTDVTVKLANVTRESAEQVSEWMTAIWNNFDDGSEKLEYYADVLAELGAATASSADEIAGGLEKFAAVADTIGLSYEYAASMLATITAETRQSEDVVGTALKTILSRMEQLNQGKTLDDGTTLGKYSQALLNVGVNIKDVNGELKDMDLILQQAGNKWNTLARDQQIALAQAVAGVRQYTQFMALMDNWDVMEKNLAMTENANGALQKQQEIYEDSVEAAEARMTASMEKVKSTLLDGDDMKGMYDLAGGFLDLVAELLESFGGLRTILLGVATALTKMYQPQIASFMSQMAISAKDLWSTMRHPIQAMKGENASQGQRFKQDVVKIAGEQTMRLGNTPGEASMRQEEAKIQEALLRNEKNMSEGAKQRAQWELQILETKRDQLLAISEAVEKEKEQNLINRDKIIKGYSDQNDASEADNYLNKREALGTAKGAGDIAQGILDTNQNVDMSKMSSEELEKLKSSLKSQVNTIQKEMKKIDFEDTNGSIEKVKKGIDKLGSDSTKDIRSLLAEVKKLNKELQNTNIDNPFDDVKLKNAGDDIENTARQQQGLNVGVEEFIGLQEGLNNKINNGGFEHWSDSVAAGISNLTTYSMGISMLASSFETLFSDIAEGNMTFTGFLSSISMIMMSLGMLVPMVFKGVGAIQKLTEAKHKQKIMADALNDTQEVDLTLQQKSIIMKKMDDGVTQKEIEEDYGEAGAAVVKAYAKNSENAGNPAKWPAFLAGLGMIAPIALMVGVAALSASGSAPTEEEQAIADEEAAKGRLDEAKQSYDNVKSSLSDYKDAQKSIDELTVGTQEWVEALQSANQQVIELLSQYPELNQFVTTAENGRMTISDEGWTYLVNQKQKQTSMASILAQGTSVRRQRVSAEADRWDLASEFGDIGKYGEQVIGYDINGNAKRIEFEGDDEDYIQDKINDLAKEYLEKGEEVFLGQAYKDLEQELSVLGETSEEVTDKIRQLVRQEQQLAAAEENLLQQRVNNILTDGLGYNSHILTQGVQKHVKDYVKNDAKYQKFDQVDLDNLDWGAGEASTIKEFQADQADTDDIVDKKLENPYAQGAWFGLDMDATEYGLEVLQDYFDDMGIDADINNTDFHKNNISYTTKGGTETTVSYEELLEYEKQKYLESRASELQAMAQKIYATGKKLKASADSAEQAVGEYLESGDIAALDVETYDAFAAMTGEERTKAIQEAVGKIDSTLLEKMGYTADEIAKKIEEQYSGLTREEVIANRLQREELAYKNTLEQGANGLGMDKNALDAYAQSLMKANSELAENKLQAAQVAVEHYKLGKGLNEVRKALEENIDTLKAANKNSLEYAEALGAIKTAIDKAFGSDVSFEFIEKEMGNIQNMLDGSVEAYDKVRRALVKDWVQNLELDETQIKQIDTLFDRLMKKADEGAATIKINADETAAIDSINELVKKGLIAESELEAAFRNANLEWGSGTTFTTYSLPQGTHSKSKVTATGPDGQETKYDIETYNETTQTLPWIGDNPPVFKNIGLAESYADAKAEFGLDETGTTNINGKDINNSKVVLVDENGNVVSDDAGVKAARENGGLVRYGYYDNGKLIKSGDSSSDFSVNTQKTYVGSSALTYDGKANETAADRKKRLKDLDKEIERYHEIDEIIQDLERDLNKISKAKERAFGANKLALIDKEIAKQKELVKADKERLKQAEKWYEVDRKNLLNSYAVKLDQDGRITNYEELIQQQVNKLKGMSETDSNYETETEYLEQMKEDFAQYEETLDEVNDQQQAVIDRQYELQDLAMEKIEYKIQIKVDAADDDLALIEFLKQKTEDNDFAAAENINITAQETAATMQKIDAENKGITKIQKELAAGKISPEQAIEKLREHRDELISLNADLIEQRNSIYENLNAQFEAFNEKFDKLTDKMESFGSTLEYYVNIVELAGKDNLGITNDILKELSQAQVNNSKNVLAVAESKLKANQDTLTLLIKQRDSAIKTYGKDSEQVKKINEQIEAVEDAVREGMKSVQEAEEAALEAVNKNFETQVNLIVETFEEAISGMYKNLEELEEAFDRQKEISDRYLENYEKTYEISKLNRQINQSLDKTNNLKSQKELRELQSQLLAMNEAGVEVSQRDIEYMQKKYDLMLAQQALEDAQNAKSAVRLKRDSEGNYGYVYTADQNTIDNAQQNYEDKLYAMQKYGEESILEIQEQLLAVNREFAEAMAELQANANLSDEEKKRKQEELLAYYTDKMRYWTEEANKQMQYGSEINLKYNTEMATTFHDTLIGQMYPDLQSFNEFYIQSQGAMSTASENFKLAVNEHYGDIQEISGKTKDKIKGDLDIVQRESGDTVTKAEELGNSMVSEMGKAASAVEAFELAYGDYMKNVRDETENTINKIGDLIGKYEDLIATKKEAAQDYSGQGTGQGPTTPTSPPITNDGGGSKIDWSKRVKEMQQWANNKGQKISIDGSWGKSSTSAFNTIFNKIGNKYVDTKEEAWNLYSKYKNLPQYKENSGTKYTTIGGKRAWRSTDGNYYTGDKVENGFIINAKKVQGKVTSAYPGATFTIGTHVKTKSQNPFGYTDAYKANGRNDTTIGSKKYNFHDSGDLGNILNLVYDRDWYALIKHGAEEDYRWVLLSNLAKYDTGGYTGEWGPEGRMAMLHQKEIVLNASDTENFLTAIEIVRSIANQMNLNNQRLSDYAKTSTTIGNVSGDTLQQEVTIHAEFPNATNHSEIEEAFGNLVNLAAQYTNRKF